MATVVSLTETKIQELLNGWVGVSLSQDDINSLITQLRILVLAQGSSLDHFNDVVRPQLEADLAAGSITVSDIQANLIPDLDLKLTEAKLTIDVLNEQTIPSMQEDLVATATLVTESPTVYTRADAPEDPDENDRYLVVGDVWYDSDDNNMQRIWNGTEWTTFGVDIPDFSITVKKFLSPTHMIY